MIRGPVEFTPPVQVEVLSQRRAVPLDENEGIYVRDIRSGKVGCGVGTDYRQGRIITRGGTYWVLVDKFAHMKCHFVSRGDLGGCASEFGPSL